MDIFITTIIATLGILFIIWGIYQMRTGKMVAYMAKHAIDEPKEAGLAFLIFGLNLLLFFAPFVYGNSATPLVPAGEFATNFAIISAPLLAIANSAFFFLAAYIGYKEHRIFAIRQDKSTKAPVAKFYKAVAILCFIRAIFFPLEKILQALLILIPFFGFSVFSAATIVFLEFFGRPLFLIIIGVLYCLVYREVRWPSKKSSTKSATKKPAKAVRPAKIAKSRKK